MKVLAIDFGLSKIGLAFSEGTLVEPLGVIRNSDKLVDKIVEICQREKIERIVIGLPEGKIGLKVKAFSRKLMEKAKLLVVFQDETLTTQQAVVKMIEGGKSKKVRKEKEDAFAAACILQEYLEKRRKNV